MSAEGVARLVAVADPRGAEGSDLLPPDTPVYDDLETLLDQERVDVVVIATPIHTHLPLAQTALAAGCAVQVEKPTTASLQQFRELVAAAEEAGRPCRWVSRASGPSPWTTSPRNCAPARSGSCGESGRWACGGAPAPTTSGPSGQGAAGSMRWTWSTARSPTRSRMRSPRRCASTLPPGTATWPRA